MAPHDERRKGRSSWHFSARHQRFARREIRLLGDIDSECCGHEMNDVGVVFLITTRHKPSLSSVSRRSLRTLLSERDMGDDAFSTILYFSRVTTVVPLCQSLSRQFSPSPARMRRREAVDRRQVIRCRRRARSATASRRHTSRPAPGGRSICDFPACSRTPSLFIFCSRGTTARHLLRPRFAAAGAPHGSRRRPPVAHGSDSGFTSSMIARRCASLPRSNAVMPHEAE